MRNFAQCLCIPRQASSQRCALIYLGSSMERPAAAKDDVGSPPCGRRSIKFRLRRRRRQQSIIARSLIYHKPYHDNRWRRTSPSRSVPIVTYHPPWVPYKLHIRIHSLYQGNLPCWAGKLKTPKCCNKTDLRHRMTRLHLGFLACTARQSGRLGLPQAQETMLYRVRGRLW